MLNFYKIGSEKSPIFFNAYLCLLSSSIVATPESLLNLIDPATFTKKNHNLL